VTWLCPQPQPVAQQTSDEEDQTMGHFSDAVAIVTGGASGIGRALCQELGQRGAHVLVTDVNSEGAEQVASGVVADGGRASAAYLDVTQADDVRRIIEDTASSRGRLDFVFNVAGICMVGEVRDMHLEQWRRIMDVNLWGVIYGTMAAYDVMLRQGSGHILNMGSADGLVPFPMMAAYAATKAAVIEFSTSLRAEAAGLGVRVSVACPGSIRTPMHDHSTLVTRLRDEDALRKQFNQQYDYLAMDADDCARAILRGVERNRGIIVITAFSRLCWWLHRLNPALIRPLHRFWVQGIREHRIA
jgi:NAD(P)-dependent dehydrogenase (short-subunit alcohol dehydrogenase family)